MTRTEFEELQQRVQEAGDWRKPESRAYLAGVDNRTRRHNLRDPREFNDDQWRAIVTHMRVYAGFAGQDTRYLSSFLQTSS